MNYMGAHAVGRTNPMPRRSRYLAPTSPESTSLKELLALIGRPGLAEGQEDLLRSAADAGGRNDVRIFYAGERSILKSPSVSVVGTREVSPEGAARSARLGRELAAHGVTVVSGLAKGVDTHALTSAIEAGGKVAAVVGTPLSKAYPAENAELQTTIWKNHVLLTPFADGEQVFRSNFPKRNRVMAAVSDATVIVEASDTSGTLHQAAECQKLGRWLFIMRSVVEDPKLTWPAKFIKYDNCVVLETTNDILKRISAGR